MKNILRIILIVCFANTVSAQQVPLTSQYMFNDYLLNPAVGGSTEYTFVSLSARAQWIGLEGSPKTQFFSAHTKLGKKMGIGGYVYNDQAGPINETGLQLSYAYHLSVTDKSKLSFSLAGLYAGHSISKTSLRAEEADDDAIDNLINRGYVGDINFGILYYSEKYKVGISSFQLLQNKLYDGGGEGEHLSKLSRHYNLHGEYSFAVSDNIDVVPSALIKYVQGAPFQFDINVRGVLKKKYWLGVSYRYNNAIAAMIGLNYKNLSFGYSYDYTMTDINSYSSGGHEVFLALKVFKKEVESSKKFD
jgi:type IX secretion system PorP/SprF family membrane protein